MGESKMKLVLALSFLLVSCEGVRPVFNLGPIGLVEKKDNRNKDDDQDRRIMENERRIEVLEQLLEVQQDAIDLLYSNVSDLDGWMDYVDDVATDILNQLDALELQVDIDLASVESELLLIQNDITILEQGNVAEIIDPCGDGPGFDEVVLKMGSGEFIAYFQQGNRRHLSVLVPGNYQTTDQQKCNFTITASGDLI
jgi:hypothetical protein